MRKVCGELFQDAGSEDGEYELTNDVAPLRQHYYYGVGLIFGKYKLIWNDDLLLVFAHFWVVYNVSG